MPLVKVDGGRIDREVGEHRAERLAWPLAEHLACDHEYLTAVEVIEKRRELEPVPAWPEVAVVEQGHLRAASLPAGTIYSRSAYSRSAGSGWPSVAR